MEFSERLPTVNELRVLELLEQRFSEQFSQTFQPPARAVGVFTPQDVCEKTVAELLNFSEPHTAAARIRLSPRGEIFFLHLDGTARDAVVDWVEGGFYSGQSPRLQRPWTGLDLRATQGFLLAAAQSLANAWSTVKVPVRAESQPFSPLSSVLGGVSPSASFVRVRSFSISHSQEPRPMAPLHFDLLTLLHSVRLVQVPGRSLG